MRRHLVEGAPVLALIVGVVASRALRAHDAPMTRRVLGVAAALLIGGATYVGVARLIDRLGWGDDQP